MINVLLIKECFLLFFQQHRNGTKLLSNVDVDNVENVER